MKFTGIENLIFDLDGTLIDSSAGVVESTNYALSRLGFAPRRAADIKRFIGSSLDEMFTAFAASPREQLKAFFQERAASAVVSSARPMDQVEETLATLHDSGYRMAVATTKFLVHTTGIIRKFGWYRYFQATASGDEVANVKPAPDLVILALRRLGASPESTLMIGDTKNDILAARAAGIRVVAVESPFGDDNLRAYKPDHLLGTISELSALLDLHTYDQ